MVWTPEVIFSIPVVALCSIKPGKERSAMHADDLTRDPRHVTRVSGIRGASHPARSHAAPSLVLHNMDHHSGLNRFLPQKFLFVIPLYIGVELVLSVAILNKAGGIYGILSLLTGHHLNFWQWVYNLLAFSTLPFYVSALFNLQDNTTNLRKMCLACSVYLLDTAIGFVYTLYFIHFWVSNEEHSGQTLNSATAADALTALLTRADDLSQSASPSRELFLTVLGVLFQTVTRIYSCSIVLSFTKKLLLQNLSNQRIHGHDRVSDAAEHNSLEGKISRFSYALEMRAKAYFQEIFA